MRDRPGELSVPFRLDSRLAWQVIDGEAIVIDLARGHTVGLNPAASLIWSLLPDHDEPDIALELTRRFEVDPDTARADVRGFVAALRERGFLTEGA